MARKLSLRRPLDPWTGRVTKKAACPRGLRLRELLAELPENVVDLRPGARARAIETGKAYCVQKCGGCELTEGWTPK